jgi:hypothetical protein
MHDKRIVHAMARQGVAGLILESQVVDRVFQNSTKQEFHREIVDALFVLCVGPARRF